MDTHLSTMTFGKVRAGSGHLLVTPLPLTIAPEEG